MNLHLLRHGLAGERKVSNPREDARRALTLEGRRKLRQVVAAIQAMDLSFDIVLSSPLVRAHQTALIVAHALHPPGGLVITPHLAPGAKPEALARQLRKLSPTPTNVLLVGHEPDMSQLMSLWLTGGPDLQVTFKKAGLCRLITERITAARCATLEWLIPPRYLKLMTAP